MAEVKGVPDNSSVVIRCQRGAQIVVPLQNRFWGDRTAWIKDPEGHVWTVATRIEDTTEEERAKRWSEIVATKGDER